MAGNSNSGKKLDKLWRDALNLALNRAGEGDEKPLHKIARKTVEMAMNGDMQAIKEIGDRMDGKPAQSVSVDGEMNHTGGITVTITNDDASL